MGRLVFNSKQQHLLFDIFKFTCCCTGDFFFKEKEKNSLICVQMTFHRKMDIWPVFWLESKLFMESRKAALLTEAKNHSDVHILTDSPVGV